MRIAVLSGKGGSGKTLISVNLSVVAPNVSYIDCDVEEPNGYLFLQPENVRSQRVYRKIPTIDNQLCTKCRACTNFCRYHALAFAGEKVIVFQEICHSCGGCSLVCKEGAITEERSAVGEIRTGKSQQVSACFGIMNMGVSSGIPIIRELLAASRNASEDTIIDCPPGSGCLVMESIRDADYCVLVAEPTIFGAHNLAMVYELVRLQGKPYGVVLNKSEKGENPSEKFCKENHVPILADLPYDRIIDKMTSDGMIAAREDMRYKEVFETLLTRIRKEANNETASDLKR